jgi:hypothetical protein
MSQKLYSQPPQILLASYASWWGRMQRTATGCDVLRLQNTTIGGTPDLFPDDVSLSILLWPTWGIGVPT